ncbi:MAG: sarcosine oxidase subunit gamma family protein [Hyphomicrobiaceae bacterium]
MTSDPRRKSALHNRRALSSPDVSIRELPFQGKLVLRGDAYRISAAVHTAISIDLPRSVKGTATAGGITAIWLAPDEWWLIVPPGEELALKSKLEIALFGTPSLVTDVTDYYTTIALEGTKARELLMKLTTIDMHPRAFKIGDAVSSNFGRAVAVLRQTRDDVGRQGPAFEILIRISMADYLWCVLAEAGHEWGLPIETPKGQVKQHLPHFDGH